MAENRSFGPLEPNRLVNRSTEIGAIGAALASKDDSPRIFYFLGGAGVGKSRLLREAREKFKSQYTFAGFYDFDDTELHSNSVLERRIRHALDPDREHFKAFRDKQKEYHEARRSGVSEKILEGLRRELAELFAQGINEISAPKKLLFCFDTVETLQREGDTVEFPEKIQEAIDKLAIEMLGWLGKNLPKMRNVVVLLAGRPKPGLHEQFEKSFGAAYQKFELYNFTPEYVKEYLEVMAETYEDAGERAIARQFRELEKQSDRIHSLTKGQPILLSFVTDLIVNSAPRSKVFDSDAPTDVDAINIDLLTRIQSTNSDIDSVLEYVALLRKGVTAELLALALNADSLSKDEIAPWDRARCQKVLDDMRVLAFAKPFPSDRKKPLERMNLHDEVYDLMASTIEQKILTSGKSTKSHFVKVCEHVVGYYDKKIVAIEQELEELKNSSRAVEMQDEDVFSDKQSALLAERNRLLATRLYYQLEADPFKGYAEYSRLSDQAIINHQVGLDMMLRDEMLRYFDLTHPDNWRLKRAKDVKETNLSPQRIMRGAAIRWVQRLNAHGQSQDAVEMAQTLQTDVKLRAQLSQKEELSKEDPLFDAILKTYEAEAYLKLDTSKTIQVAGDAIKLFDDADLKDKYPDLRTQLHPRHLGRAYNNRAYAHTREYRFDEAVLDYQAALPLLRATGLPHQKADTIKNLAFTYTNTGQLLAAGILGHEAIRICQENKLDYLEGLGWNTLAIVELTADRPHRAAAYAKRALEIFENAAEGENRRGMGLANLVLGKAYRARAQLDIYSAQETTELFETSAHALQNGYDTFRADSNWHELARELEALQALGCLYRQWALWEKTREGGSAQLADKLGADSLRHLELALEKAEPKYAGMRADILNDLAELFWVQGDKARALDYADQSDAVVSAVSRYYFITERKQPEEPRPQLYVILGKNELLRARLALEKGNLKSAAQRFTAASAYFDRFEGDQTTRELLARRTYRMYRNMLEAKLLRAEPLLAARKIDQFRQDVEQFQRQKLVSPWPHRTTTLGDNFDVIWSDLHRVLEL